MATPVHERPVRRSVLRSVLGAGGGSTQDRISRALELVVEDLDMQVGFLGRLQGGDRVVTHAVAVPGAVVVPVGTSHPLHQTLCSVFLDEAVGPVVPDVGEEPLLARHPHATLFDVRAYAAVPVRSAGRLWGVLCCASSAPTRPVQERDIALLRTVAEHLGDVVAGLDTDPAEGSGEPSGWRAGGGAPAVDRRGPGTTWPGSRRPCPRAGPSR